MLRIDLGDAEAEKDLARVTATGFDPWDPKHPAEVKTPLAFPPKTESANDARFWTTRAAWFNARAAKVNAEEKLTKEDEDTSGLMGTLKQIRSEGVKVDP
jgi:hypothetical protein